MYREVQVAELSRCVKTQRIEIDKKVIEFLTSVEKHVTPVLVLEHEGTCYMLHNPHVVDIYPSHHTVYVIQTRDLIEAIRMKIEMSPPPTPQHALGVLMSLAAAVPPLRPVVAQIRQQLVAVATVASTVGTAAEEVAPPPPPPPQPAPPPPPPTPTAQPPPPQQQTQIQQVVSAERQKPKKEEEQKEEREEEDLEALSDLMRFYPEVRELVHRLLDSKERQNILNCIKKCL